MKTIHHDHVMMARQETANGPDESSPSHLLVPSLSPRLRARHSSRRFARCRAASPAASAYPLAHILRFFRPIRRLFDCSLRPVHAAHVETNRTTGSQPAQMPGHMPCRKEWSTLSQLSCNDRMTPNREPARGATGEEPADGRGSSTRARGRGKGACRPVDLASHANASAEDAYVQVPWRGSVPGPRRGLDRSLRLLWMASSRVQCTDPYSGSRRCLSCRLRPRAGHVRRIGSARRAWLRPAAVVARLLDRATGHLPTGPGK